MGEQTYTLSGRVVDQDTQAGVPELQVELWDLHGRVDGAVGFTLTDDRGNFRMSFTASFFRELFGDQLPYLYIKVFSGDTLLTSTEESFVWDTSRGDASTTVQVRSASDRTFTVTGSVYNERTGERYPDVRVEAWDLDGLRDSGAGSTMTDADGNFRLDLQESGLRQIYGDTIPNFYFKVFSGDTELVNTRDTIHWNVEESGFTANIAVPQADNSYTVNVHLFGALTGNAMGGLTVEVWDSNHAVASAIASAVADSSGNVSFTFSDSSLYATFGANVPTLFFKVFSGSTLSTSTEGSQTWHPTNGNATYEISVPEQSNNSYTVTVSLVGAVSGNAMAGLRVEAWDSTHVVNAAIASAVSDTAGNAVLTFTDASLYATFGANVPALYFNVFSGSTLEASTEGSQTWRTTNGNATYEIVIPEDQSGGGDPPSEDPRGSGQRGCGEVTATTYSVSGTVTSPTHAGMGGLQVKLFDKRIGGDAQLGQGVIDDCGQFRMTFSADQITSSGKLRPDLQLKVYNGTTQVAASEVRYNAFPDETINVSIPADATGLPSEFESLTSAIGKHYSGALNQLQENDQNQDISYLANKSGWDARAVAMAALADQFSRQTGASPVNPAYFYALFRAGVPANDNVLYHTDAATLTQIWNNAAQQGVLPGSLAEGIPTAVSRFQQMSSQKLLTGPAVAGPSTMQQMLQTSGLDQNQQRTFTDLLSRNLTNTDAFWTSVTNSLGAATANRLKVDGKLALLTINNAPLMAAVRQATGGTQLTDTLQLAQAGYSRVDRWEALLTENMPIPAEIPGESAAEKRSNYAEYLAAQVRLSYPTASVAEMVSSGDVPLEFGSQVQSFLTQHQGDFELGMQPVEQYIAQNDLQVAPEVVDDLNRLQRVYQITPNDEAMTGLLNNGLDAAAYVAQYDRDTFVETFGNAVGGADTAQKIHERAVEVHNAVLNIAISYLTASNGIPLGAPTLDPDNPEQESTGMVLQPKPKGAGSVTLSGPYGLRSASGPYSTPASDILAYATLETLFGEMDYCACDHCRSILSPAAYLVDLLNFCNQPAPPPGSSNPLTVLLARRPDLQHLPLTCENTNTALPYIDVVNETLEYYVVNSLSLSGYLGHDTGTMTTEDLLASPAFVIDTAYTTLANQRFPMPLPFHRPLESLRRHIEKFGITLPLAMERLRPNDNLERLSAPYGWRDILMEELDISRKEYEIFTDTSIVPLWSMYGFPSGTVDATVIAGLSNAKKFCRRLGISYDDLVALLRTRFINPNALLIPRLERLGVTFPVMKQLYTGAISVATFNSMLPTGAGAPNPADYGGSISGWVISNYSQIMSLVTLADINGGDPCSFDTLELRFALPMASPTDTSTRLTAVEYVRILRFIRLWKKLGWTIDETDAALSSLYRSDLAPITGTDIDTLAELNTGFLTLLPRLGLVFRVMRELNLTPRRDMLSTLALWSDISTIGDNSLYAQMFLTPTILGQDPVYVANVAGDYLTDTSVKIAMHAESLRAAFNLTSDDFTRIFNSLAYDANTPLTIPKITKIFRRGWLARALKISVRELLMLMTVTGYDPFAAPSPTGPDVMKFIGLVEDLKELGLKTTTALYLVWNQDLSGQSGPTTAQINEFIRALRDDFMKINQDFTIVDDPTGEIARARMTLVYGVDATDFYFGLLNDTFVSEAPYSHFEPAFGTQLALAVKNAGGSYGASGTPRVAYDNLRKVLTFTGRMDTATRTALLNVATAPAVVSEVPGGQYSAFQTAYTAAINALYTANSSVINPFFTRYSELLAPFVTFADPLNTNTPAQKRTTLLNSLLVDLVKRRKTQQALQRLADATQTDRAFAEALVNPTPLASGLYSALTNTEPALNDFVNIEKQGLTVKFYQATSIGPNPLPVRTDSNLVYAASANPLPANTVSPGNPISGVWSGSIEAPENGYYNFYISAEVGSTVTMTIDGVAVPMAPSGTVWSNTAPLTLKASQLYAVQVTVLSVTNNLKFEWETIGRGRAPIDARFLYPSVGFGAARDSYLRFLKAGALAKALHLTAAETARPVLSGTSWLNSLPINGSAPTPTLLLPPLREAIDFAILKKRISPDNELLLKVMLDPTTATATADSLLYTLTGWDPTSLTALVTQFVGTVSNLSQPAMFRRVYDAFELTRSVGISTTAMIAVTTNDPTSTQVQNFQSALRARYSAEDWRTLVQPINDQMRALQRDALVAYILHQLRANPLTQHINTENKLFEYFLMDVQMEPCMQTSRVRHALSSVQLFIERVLMSLEKNVSPKALNADQWEWMKRYRVWEANRKVFLFPENWLEPELRDDKSPFFKELETELLSNDVTEESASIAMLNYLAKLEEVARLEPVGFHHIPYNAALRIGEVNHVVARTPGANRKYYYRRREYGYWTAWEDIKLDIEDNPVIPVIWKDRLLLLWLKLVRKGPDSTSGQKPGYTSSGEDLAHVNVPAAPQETVQAILCWSEYYNGKWQAPKTSDSEHPADLGSFSPGGAYKFDRASLTISTVEEGDTLRVNVGGSGWATFLMYNTHSTPAQGSATYPSGLWAVAWYPSLERNISDFSGTLTFGYITNSWWTSSIMSRQVLQPTIPYGVVLPTHPLPDPWNVPLFYHDKRHVFYVSSVQQQVFIRDYWGFGITPRTGVATATRVPGLVIPSGTVSGATASWASGTAPADRMAGASAVGLFVSEDANIHQAFATTAPVSYGGTPVGPSGGFVSHG